MKLNSLLIPAIAIAGIATANAQQTTTPVGYTTITLPGTGGSGSSKLQIASQGLLPSGATQYTGSISAADAGYIEDSSGTWSAGDFVGGNNEYNHVVEITSGDLAGSMTWITSAPSGVRLNTVDDLSAANGESFRILKCYTLATLFGATPDASALAPAGDQSTADNFLIQDPTTGLYTTYYYKNAGIGQGWKKSGAPGTFADEGIFPTDGLVIVRKQSDDGELVISGEVRTSATDVAVVGNGTGDVLNIVSIPNPVGQISLSGSGLYTGDAATGIAGGGDQSSADNLLVLDAATGLYTTYYYKNAGIGQGWKKSGAAGTHEDEIIPAGSALLIIRKSADSFTWEIPAVTIGE